MNTQKINQLISSSTFDNAFTVLDNFVFINLDWLTNRDYQSQGVNELIYISGQYKDYIFVFLIRDGVNCRITGLDYIIRTIVTNLNLTENTCYIYGYDDLEIANTTYIKLDVVQMWCSLIYKQLHDYTLDDVKFTKKFAALFGRHDLYRLKIFKYLKENYNSDSILSYNSNKAHWNQRFGDQFAQDQTWYHANCPCTLDFTDCAGWVPYQHSLEKIVNHAADYFIEIACETDIYSNKFFTEKSLKNFYLGKPFILMSGQHSLDQLHSHGFQTFSPWIDESYDKIACPKSRLDAILIEIDKIANYSFETISQIHAEMMPTFEHNRKNFLKFV